MRLESLKGPLQVSRTVQEKTHTTAAGARGTACENARKIERTYGNHYGNDKVPQCIQKLLQSVYPTGSQ
jgi:hypothetical protein